MVLEEFIRSGAANCLLQRLILSPSDQEALQRYSYKHANGFTKLVLARTDDDRFRLRLHFWPKDQADQNVHDHRFRFWSVVLRGSIRSEIWVESGQGDDFSEYQYLPRRDSRSYSMRYVRHTRLARHSESSRAIGGSSYFFDSNWLHTVSCSESPITVVIEDRSTLREYARVFSKNYEASTVTIDSPPLSASEYQIHLLEALRWLPLPAQTS